MGVFRHRYVENSMPLLTSRTYKMCKMPCKTTNLSPFSAESKSPIFVLWNFMKSQKRNGLTELN